MVLGAGTSVIKSNHCTGRTNGHRKDVNNTHYIMQRNLPKTNWKNLSVVDVEKVRAVKTSKKSKSTRERGREGKAAWK